VLALLLAETKFLGLTGVEASGILGFVGVPLLSVEASGVGSVTPSQSVAVLGVTGSGEVGTVLLQLSVALSGVAASGAVNTVTPR
jgi:hypothetical protein